jgi:hypothetical protein
VLKRHGKVQRHSSREVTKGAMARTAVRAERALADGGPWLDKSVAEGTGRRIKPQKDDANSSGGGLLSTLTRGCYYLHLSHPINKSATTSGQEVFGLGLSGPERVMECAFVLHTHAGLP